MIQTSKVITSNITIFILISISTPFCNLKLYFIHYMQTLILVFHSILYWLVCIYKNNFLHWIMWKREKKSKYSFWLQKQVKNQILHVFQTSNIIYIVILVFFFKIWISFEWSSFKKYFSVTFYAKMRKKMAKYNFRLQKGVKIQNLIIGMCSWPKK